MPYQQLSVAFGKSTGMIVRSFVGSMEIQEVEQSVMDVMLALLLLDSIKVRKERMV